MAQKWERPRRNEVKSNGGLLIDPTDAAERLFSSVPPSPIASKIEQPRYCRYTHCRDLQLKVIPMTDVTHILSQIEQGDPAAAEQLLPLVYEELRKLAAARLAKEKPGQTLQATALVHDAYLRLVNVEKAQHWNSRGHFFSAAAEAMRRILIEIARKKSTPKHGGDRLRVELSEADAIHSRSDDLLALNDVIQQLEEHDEPASQLVKLRYFGGLTMTEAADVMGISQRTAERNWTYAKTWLHAKLSEG